MGEAEELLAWLNQKVDTQVTSLTDQKISRSICYYLVNLAGSPAIAEKCTMGKNPFERATNFQYVKSLMGMLDCPFPFNLEKLKNCDANEVLALLRAVAAIGAKPEASDGMSDDDALDALMGELEEDLARKLEAAEEFQRQMDLVARERDFYFDKLRRILDATRTQQPGAVVHVVRVIEVPPADF